MHLRLASKDLVKSLQTGQRLDRRANPTKTVQEEAGWQPKVRDRRSASPPRRRNENPGEDRWTRK